MMAILVYTCMYVFIYNCKYVRTYVATETYVYKLIDYCQCSRYTILSSIDYNIICHMRTIMKSNSAK